MFLLTLFSKFLKNPKTAFRVQILGISQPNFYPDHRFEGKEIRVKRMLMRGELLLPPVTLCYVFPVGNPSKSLFVESII